MKKFLLAVMSLMLVSVPAFAGGGLNVFLDNLNVEAGVDLPGFSARISSQFGVPVPRVQAVVGAVAEPADAFMVFQLGQMTGMQNDRVLSVYQANRGKGWGVIAQKLGIKPGSKEFHALKRGDFVLAGGPAGKAKAGKGMGKGTGKGHKK
ncbi:MAG TPA: hypothetical protein PLI53_10480 [Geobacteraceae bacterium]|nr:hypothetical protein [Geobacteraceae bacterium]